MGGYGHFVGGRLHITNVMYARKSNPYSSPPVHFFVVLLSLYLYTFVFLYSDLRVQKYVYL